MHGAWEILEDIPTCNLPQEVATGFQQVTENLLGGTYDPLLYCAKQIVAGVNHMIICKQTLTTYPAKVDLVKFVIHQSLQGEFNILSIESIM